MSAGQNSLKETLEREVLPFVDRPARYTGGEYHSVLKDPSGMLRVALVYPDAYEIGISNIGLKILYGILNRMDGVYCERAYAPWLDMEKALRDRGLPLFSLETGTPLGEFDVIGFSFQYELLFTNFLNILDMSGVPLYSAERGGQHPLVIGGGPVMANPEPAARFLDAVCVGDGEEAAVRIVEAVIRAKKEKLARKGLLSRLSQIEGVYVPSLYAETEKSGAVIAAGPKVRRAVLADLEPAGFVTDQVIPNTQAVQDRAVVEVSRGCSRGCRFCQAGVIYRPVRERSVGRILELARRAVLSTGYREFSLVSLSISDYSDLPGLIRALGEQFSPHGVSFSLPSLRLDSFTLELAKSVQEIRKSGLTFAVEGGSQNTRDRINKNVSEEELLRVVTIARDLGWRTVKLYFMIGLPCEGDEISDISGLVRNISCQAKGIGITVSAAVFIPKAHTPYQWSAQMGPEEGLNAFHRLIDVLRDRKNVNIRYNNPYVSFLEGVFSRGDRKLSTVAERAFRAGARFDSWSDQLNMDLWMRAFVESGIDPYVYLRERDKNAALPWSVIDARVGEGFLKEEREKSGRGEPTPDCREGCANNCGNCDFSEIGPKLQSASGAGVEIDGRFMEDLRMDAGPAVSVRLLYSKLGPARYLSQIDLEEQLARAYTRAGIPAVFTRGFNPHIRMEMGQALPVGFESDYEIARIELSRAMDGKGLAARLNASMPQGIIIREARVMPPAGGRLSKILMEHSVLLSIGFPMDGAALEANLAKSAAYRKITPKTETVLDLREYIKKTELTGNGLNITYVHKDGGARIQDIIGGVTGLDVRTAAAHRPRVLERWKDMDGHKVPLMEV